MPMHELGGAGDRDLGRRNGGSAGMFDALHERRGCVAPEYFISPKHATIPCQACGLLQ